MLCCNSQRLQFEPDHFQGDKELPVYSRPTSAHSVGELVNVLLKSDIDQQRVCTVQPLGVTENASFVVDIDTVHFDDLKADDLGVWSPTGTKRTYFRFTHKFHRQLVDIKGQ